MSSRVSATPTFWVGLDVHEDSVTAAVFRDRDPEPMRVDRLPNEHKRIQRRLHSLGRGSVAQLNRPPKRGRTRQPSVLCGVAICALLESSTL